MEKRATGTAGYQVIADAKGRRFRFCCDLSGLAVHTTAPLSAPTEGDSLRLAWQKDGRQHFNACHKCGKWVCDAMYNANVWKFIACAPWEVPPSFCCQCGAKLSPENLYCRRCGAKLRYGEVDENDGASA